MGDEKEQHREEHANGLSSIDKTLVVGNARIAYSIWEVPGNFYFIDLRIYIIFVLCLWEKVY